MLYNIIVLLCAAFAVRTTYNERHGTFMAFSNLFFIFLFLPLCTLLYFLAKNQYRNTILIVFSLIFYAFGEPVYIWLLLLSTFLNYIFGRVISTADNPNIPFAVGAVLNIGILASFKLTEPLITAVNTICSTDIHIPYLQLPLGLSFFTLRALSYLADCRSGKIDPERKLSSFILYMTMFPLTAQGPVVRYETVQNQLYSREITAEDFSAGLGKIAVGLGKKILLADKLAIVSEQLLGSSTIENQSTLGTWYGALAFTLQLYFDLSGYSDIAIGIGRIFGFKFEENFRYPFMCKNITGFWQRWHISLSSFFKDYLLYTPLFRKHRVLAGVVVMGLCTGLWHGLGWNYVIWGIFFGLIMMCELWIGKEKLRRLPTLVRHLYTKLAVIIGFTVFSFTDMGSLWICLKNMFFFSEAGAMDVETFAIIEESFLLMIAALIGCCPWFTTISKKLETTHSTKTYTAIHVSGTVLAALIVIVCCIVTVNSGSRPFIYMQF